MKKAKGLAQPSELPVHQKLAENLLKKKPKKQFQLLYRQRDESVQQNPIESIIFVKSKPCKPASNDKKIKVQEEFKKIMNDLNAHINQHKKNSSKSEKKNNFSAASSQLKATVSTKKCTKQSEFMSTKKNKPTERDQHKILKTANRGFDHLAKQKSPTLQVCKSPKKGQKGHLSPKTKNFFSPKSPKIQKQNIETKRFNTNQKLQKKKSPQIKTNRKESRQEIWPEETAKKTKPSFLAQPSQRANETTTKSEIKRNIRTIPLKVEEYILIEDNFELIKQKSLYKLETKLLSTYRNNNFRDFENKILLKQNSDQDQIVFERINRDCFQQSSQNFIQRSQTNSESNLIVDERLLFESESQLNSEGREKQMDQCEFKEFVGKIQMIQKWWRNVLKIQNIKAYILKLFQKQNLTIQKQQKQQNGKNFTTPVNLPSAQSIEFNDVQMTQQNEQEESKIEENEQITMLKNQNQIVRQKKDTHEKILNNLLKEKKITKEDFEKKISLVQKQYEKQLKDIMGLYKIIEFGRNSDEFDNNEQNLRQNQNYLKIIQGEQSNSSASRIISNKCSPQKVSNNDIALQNEESDSEIPMKIYKIGDKITTQMRSYIETSKKTKEASRKIQTEYQQENEFVLDKYNKKTNELGQQYFEDFESDSSNDPSSPHKMLQASNFEEFESNIDAINHGASFQPNAHFIKMIQQYKEQEMIKTKIQQRIATQMGAIKPETQQKYLVDTSILGVHQFLVNFFKFYLHYYKDEFLRFINMPYGYQAEKRLKFIQGYEDTSDDLSEDSDGIIYGLEYIISDDVFDEFIEQYYESSLQNANQQQKALIQCSQIHDRALFECFNEALNNFRPYFSIGGPPYIWNCSQKTLTFYFIAEQNIQQVFEKTEFRVMKWASALLGLFVDGYQQKSDKNIKPIQSQHNSTVEQILQNNHSSSHPVVFQNRQQRLIKQQRLELIESMLKWGDIEEQKASTLYELSSVILEELAQEMVNQFLLRRESQSSMIENFE